MYSVKLDENKYFTGRYAIIGKVDGGIDIDSLPPIEDYSKSLCYKYEYIEKSETSYVPVIDEETGEQKLDENGEPLFTEDVHIINIMDWVFDEVKYKEYLDSELNKPVEQTLKEKIAFLVEENDLLKWCIMELADEVYA